MNDRLIIFTRYPVPGSTKTRLIPALGADGAAMLHREMTERIVFRMKKLADLNVDVEIRYTSAGENEMRSWLGDGLLYRPQSEGDLGDRLSSAFKDAFAAGAPRVIAVGSDSPALSRRIIAKAFARLEMSEAVVGPTFDGGYFLVGSRRYHEALFNRMPWSTDRLLKETLAALERSGVSVSILSTLHDVDRPEDLERLRRLSIVIPAFNEERRIHRALGSVSAERDEVVVVDGGSTDATPHIVAEAGVRLIVAPKGRGSQMNAGAEETMGDTLLFLHADTKLPADYLSSIRESICNGYSAGAFRLGIDSRRKIYRVIENGANVRSKLLRLPYGDQGFFVTRRAFEAVNGFRELAEMEDFDLVSRLARTAKLAILDSKVETAADRWERSGPVFSTIHNQLTVARYLGRSFLQFCQR